MLSSWHSLSTKRGGSILVMVLVFVVILSFVVVAFLEEATARIKYFGLFHQADDLRVDAYSALDISLAVLNEYREIEGSLWGPSQGWGDPLRRVEFNPNHASTVSVRFEDEGGKIPLQSLDYALMLRIFDILGFDLSTAELLSDSLIDWTDEDDLRRLNGFDGDDYEDYDPAYQASNKQIETWDEFELIHGFRENFFNDDGNPLPVFEEFKSMVSLYHEGAVNINKASPLLLEMLEAEGLFDSYGYDYYRNGADGEFGTEDDRIARQADDYIEGELEGLKLNASIESLLVEVTATRGEAQFVLQALVTWVGSNPAANNLRSEVNEEDQGSTVNEPSSTEGTRPDPRGETKTKTTSGANVGYPFKIVKLLENSRI